MLDDFRRLWNTNFLDDLSIDVQDYTFANGVIGKVVTYNLEERQRVKIVDFTGSKKIDTSKIDETLRTANASIRLDTFIDPGLIRKVEGILRDMMKEKGFQFAEITHEIKPVAGGPKLIHLTFNVEEGPEGQDQDDRLRGQQRRCGRRPAEADEREQGTVGVLVHHRARHLPGNEVRRRRREDPGLLPQPGLHHGAGRRAHAQLRRAIRPEGTRATSSCKIPVIEGTRYRVGKFEFAGNTVVKSELLRPLFKIKAGDYYSQDRGPKGLPEGAGDVRRAAGTRSSPAFRTTSSATSPTRPIRRRRPRWPPFQTKPAGPPVADVTMQITEGKQFFVNRITFVGNTTTRDNVIRRELRLYENDDLRHRGAEVQHPPAQPARVLQGARRPAQGRRVREDARRRRQDGRQVHARRAEPQPAVVWRRGLAVRGLLRAAVLPDGEFPGPRREPHGVAAGGLARADLPGLASPSRSCSTATSPAARTCSRTRCGTRASSRSRRPAACCRSGSRWAPGFTRMFVNYSYENTRVTELSSYYRNPVLLAQNPFLRDSLLIGAGRLAHHQQGRAERRAQHRGPADLPDHRQAAERVDRPRGPWRQHELLQADGRGDLVRPAEQPDVARAPRSDGVHQHLEESRSAFRSSSACSSAANTACAASTCAPSGRRTTATGLILGGNKSLLFNVEQLITIAGPVRLILFYDAGQVQDFGDAFSWWEDRIVRIPPPTTIVDPFATRRCWLTPTLTPGCSTTVVGKQAAFKTSTGAEIRFFMPVLNVPFRLIFAVQPVARRRAEQRAPAAGLLPVPVCRGNDVLIRSASFRTFERTSAHER